MLGYFGEPGRAVRELRHLPVAGRDLGRHDRRAETAVGGAAVAQGTGQRYGAGQVIDILLGRKTPKVTEHDHASLTVFGIGTDLRESEWRGVVRQLLAQGLLAVGGDYGTLALTEASGAALAGERQVPLRREQAPARVRAKSSRPGPQPAAELPAAAAGLFERLRFWRAAAAREQGVPGT